ncbi:sulfatase-like hydrolase/transferase [Maribellus comscasis]|uniref:Sulfatase-like hydrolase/transferase n=1 Tax=Maribellus comscasis TaxID=2681766 RepID=A0A6I6JUJ7_9BACT|nr:arylsulfatase [Maribellus comscasis]QGY46211.1 sulfatase-like hydrolase/transferase [Maribellus comscasis]
MIIKNLLWSLTIISMTACVTPTPSTTENSKPNIVFILADDLGYGDVSSFNENSKIQTPNIDQLAQQGVRFTDAHTSSAVCTPTRYGILTGRYNWRSTLKKGVLNGYSEALIPRERETVASFLQKNGYQTGCIGKWHLGWTWNSIEKGNNSVDFSKKITGGPTTLGFDYFYGFCGSLDMPPYVWVENDAPTMVPTKTTVREKGQDFWREGLTSDDFDHELVLNNIADKAKTFIHTRANKEKPFFLYLPLSAPHTPILPTPGFQGKSGLENPYADFVLMVDHIVGEISQQLEEEQITNNTILFFTSDNGCSPMANFEQLATKGHNPSYVFRGTKADIFEGGHRVPYIVQFPNKIKPAISNQMVCTTDLFATVADLLGIAYGDNVAEDSFSLLPALKIESGKPVREAIVHHSINGMFAIRKGEWKLALCPGSGGWSYPRPGKDDEVLKQLPQVQLYNLKNDIEEQSNLQAEHPEIVKEYRDLLSDYIEKGRSTAGSPQTNDGPGKWPQLNWLDE